MKLFVGNLPYSVDDNGLGAIFVKYGNVTEAKVIMDKMTGKSKGFGFVDLEGDGELAIKELNESQVAGRKIYVSPARPRSQK